MMKIMKFYIYFNKYKMLNLTNPSLRFSSNDSIIRQTVSPSMYEALSHPVDINQGHEPDLTIYRNVNEPTHGIYNYRSPFSGYVKGKDGKYWNTHNFEIAYTQWGDKGPLVLLLHGVPSNRYLYFPIQNKRGSNVRF